MVYGLNASLAIVDLMGAGLRANVKREVSEHMLKEGDRSNGHWDRKSIDKQWEAHAWAVVQFTSLEG